MDQKSTAVVKQDGGWWIDWVDEVPDGNSQQSDRKYQLTSLRLTLTEPSAMDCEEARLAAG